MKSVNTRGHPALSDWVTDSSTKAVSTPRESVLELRPILELKGTSQKTLKFFFVNLDILIQFIESHNFVVNQVFCCPTRED